MSKRRSGLKNDKRAYKYCCPPPQICNPITISITDITTISGGDYLLNGDTTIESCEILEIGYGNNLIISPYKLINRGTINNQYGIIGSGSTSNNIINMGIINNQNGAIVNFNGGIIDNTGGTIDNTSGGFINNNLGIIYNTGGTIDNSSDGLIYNTGGTIYLGDGTCGTIGTIITSGGFILGNTPSNTCP